MEPNRARARRHRHTTLGEGVWDHRHRPGPAVCRPAIGHGPGRYTVAGPGSPLNHDHDTPPPQVRAHRACHFLGRLARRGRRLPGSRHRRSDQPGCQMVRAAYLAMELTGWFVIVPLSLRLAADRACPVTGHHVGLVPALLGPGETPAQPSLPPSSCCCTRRPSARWRTSRETRQRQAAIHRLCSTPVSASSSCSEPRPWRCTSRGPDPVRAA